MNLMKPTIQKYVNDASSVYKGLNGLFLVYKPPLIPFGQVRATVILKLANELNNMYVRPPVKYVSIDGPTNMPLKVVVRDSYADNPLVVGPRYQNQDFRLSCTKLMDKDASGVVICGINDGNSMIRKIRESKSTRFYKVTGKFGIATNNYFWTGKVIEKSTYNHIRRGHIDKLCSAMQSSHQRKMFELCGVDMQSQTAYELATKGLLRPLDSKIPMLYTIRCIDFSPPEFTLEIVCVNEYEMYLKTIIHDIGMQLQSTATCTNILCIQDGLFTLQDALLKKHWNLTNILNSIRFCRRILINNEHLWNQESPTLIEHKSNTESVENF
ncbi:pseudouridylate synthase TRUB2, mitochondrial [Nomia melanderi]|uniref:pseudouridylate synthase TRUB2, mitochondrial n=1 Tax=Nomia melanderi TaxID=2448451 RepID=UPI0013041B02|nr:mitochondrial mRNA pseudouridine synthase Trub2 [Nomia melanderi]